jgi:hypothetical protein
VIEHFDAIPWRAVLAAFLVAQGLALALLAVVSLVRIDRGRDGPAFRALSNAMGLSPASRRLLVRATRLAGIGSDAACLVSQGCFERVLRKAPLSDADRRSLQTLGKSVFGRLSPSHARGYPVRRAPRRHRSG